LDAEIAAPLTAAELGSISNVSMLDIGAGDGEFTRNFLKLLSASGVGVKRVVAVDPLDYATDYKTRVGECVRGGDVDCLTRRLEEARITEKFGLVLASHSLYGVCDNQGGDPKVVVDDVLRSIGSHTERDGLVVAILACGHARSYHFKRAATELLYGEPVEDLVAERLEMVPGFNMVRHAEVDSVMVMDEVWRQYEEGRMEGLREWLSYFLRSPVGKGAALSQLAELLSCYLQTVGSLPLGLRDACLRLQLSAATLVLPHRSRVFVARVN
jgi:SAM-dependent methyltransferase